MRPSLKESQPLPTAPLYLSEIAPEKIRGSMISMYQLM
ncbi:MFS transporter, partial [Escherichia coli]